MSPSLPPPPRKLSSSSASGNSAPRSPRYPKINPNSLALSDPYQAQAEDDQDLDRALAELLGQSSLAANDNHHNPHLPQCKYYTNNSDNYYNSNHTTSSGRPLSITSLSSLGSGSFTSYGGHSRRVSQALLSPLSPALSEPSSSGHNPFFNTVPESDECPFSLQQQTQHSIGSDVVSQGTATGTTTIEQDMGMVSSSMPSCTYCSSVRSNSICSSGTADDKLASPTALHAAQSIHASSPPTSTNKNRNSLQMAFDTNRLAALKEFIPSEVRLRLSYHLDECWFVEFSPDGKWMASTGLDQSVIIWQDVLVRFTFFILLGSFFFILYKHKTQNTNTTKFNTGVYKSKVDKRGQSRERLFFLSVCLTGCQKQQKQNIRATKNTQTRGGHQWMNYSASMGFLVFILFAIHSFLQLLFSSSLPSFCTPVSSEKHIGLGESSHSLLLLFW